MKVAINACHGSFGLSPAGIKLYCQKANINCYFFNIDYTKDDKYKVIWSPTENPTGALRWQAFSIPNPSEEKDAHKYIIKCDFKNDRGNKFLIETINELGEKANGAFSKLKVVEVPDDVKWHIAEFDGWEWVAEDHRTWE
jgi:hypothetical protein